MLRRAFFFCVVALALWVPFHLTAKLDRAAEIAGDIRMSRAFDGRHLAEIVQASQSAGMFLVADRVVTFVLATLACTAVFDPPRRN